MSTDYIERIQLDIAEKLEEITKTIEKMEKNVEIITNKLEKTEE